MKSINFDMIDLKPLLSRSSKGDQMKWFLDGNWIKIDNYGYESLAEVLVSRLMGKSDMATITEYEPVEVTFGGKRHRGCISKDFLKADEEIFTFENMHFIDRGKSLSATIDNMNTVRDRIEYTVDFIADVTGRTDAGSVITAWVEADALFLNEDRHFNNMAAIRNYRTKEWRFCPFFDNGLSLLSDIGDYPMGIQQSILKRKVKAKPFSTSFSKQVEEAENLYGISLMLHFSMSDVHAEIGKLKDIYDEATLGRVESLIGTQMNRYGRFFG